jgi:hypothetical protein
MKVVQFATFDPSVRFKGALEIELELITFVKPLVHAQDHGTYFVKRCASR